ncbi:nucleolar MIF4G domain-containing protein 1 [Asbolus verrucosus]|uniref:Nucleolar MIF4G domain-containing protein 1 n=1 Tax=Asbolus verrucosus TaxID=1661398 RepID=A0A482VAA6_ASBVE|nr:nucleolar MIF4G domain-containing protein 1 [Asbolus verrucosus]
MFIKKRKNNSNIQKSRKQLRKEERKNKKIRRNEYYTNRRKPGQFVLINKNGQKEDRREGPLEIHNQNEKIDKSGNKLESEKLREKEKKQQKKLQAEMNKQRNKQLVEANLEEDRNIKRLEKQLKIHKRKSKAVPKSFSVDDLLEVCDSENLKSSALAEQQLTEINDEFEEDLALMTENVDDVNVDSDDSEINSQDFEEASSSDDELNSSDESCENMEESDIQIKKRPIETERINLKRRKLNSESSDSGDLSDQDNESVQSNETLSNHEENNHDERIKNNKDGTWEDIYGRLRAADGSIINESSQKYIPPAVRLSMEGSSVNKVRDQKLERLRKQLKGLLNRLAESNMHNIATQLEELYMNNSRNDMNNTITNLIIEALISNILAPERLLMEHVLLVTILHANIGTEVGAHFLQSVVKLFDEYFRNQNTESKKLDNVVVILAQLYNFKLFDSKLIFEVLNKLVEHFEEKDVECILHILRNVGFNLRKDDPTLMKNFILTLQKKAANVTDELKNNSRVKFMLDVLLAIKNNNVSKIPNYDTTYSEHLKKIMKGFIRKGNYVTQLNISLEDLLKVEEKGRWWVIGSAWAGNTTENNDDSNVKEKTNNFSQNLLELARKQRMNTDTRKNIFCIIMSAEDYLDAFEKLLRLALKNQQEREIIHVILHCCLQEKKYNPFYAILAQKFCEYDRKYQVVEFSELDKVSLRFMRQILLRILLHEDLEACKGVFEKVSHSDKLKMFRESLKLFIYHFLLRNVKSGEIPDDKKQLLQGRVKIIDKLLTSKEIKF